ncbi:MAG: 30S ribosomal protein S9 [archaeon]
MAVTKSSVAIGKKKSAKARATVTKGTGCVRINSVELSKWGTMLERTLIQEPLSVISNVSKDLDISVNVTGGGALGQAAASRTAISKAIVKFTGKEDVKKMLIEYDDKILAGDSRQREPYKPGDSSPRSRRQKSYR